MTAESGRAFTPTDPRPLHASAPDDERLLRQLEANPRSGLGAIYDRYGALVYGLARAMLASSDEAQDVTQETFLSLCDNYRRYDPARGSLPAFLVSMARSRALDRLRARTRRTELMARWKDAIVPASLGGDPHLETTLEQTRTRVRDALRSLPEDQARVLSLAYYKGLTQTEIAEHLSVPLGTVKAWTRRGLFALRDALGDLAERP